MKRLFFLLMVFAVLAGCASSGSFSEKVGALQRTEKNFYSSGIVPVEIPKIAALQSALNKLKVSLSRQPNSAENSALSALIDAKTDLLEMQLSFERGKLEMAKARFSEADCEPAGALVKAVIFFDNAVASAANAKARLASFFKAYPAEARQTGISLSDYSATIDAVSENSASLRDGVSGLC